MDFIKIGKNKELLDNYIFHYNKKNYNSITINYLIDMIKELISKIETKDLESIENRNSLSEKGAYYLLERLFDKYRYKIFNLKLNYDIEMYIKNKNNKNNNYNSKPPNLLSEQEISSRLMLSDLIDPNYLQTNLDYLEDDIENDYVYDDYESNED